MMQEVCATEFSLSINEPLLSIDEVILSINEPVLSIIINSKLLQINFEFLNR